MGDDKIERQIKYIEKIMKNENYKLTRQRKILIKIFLENSSKHFTPSELHQELKNNGSSVGIATVYRNLKVLVILGIIEEMTSSTKKLYELKIFGRKSVHTHCYCIDNGKIINFSNTSTSLKIIRLIDKVEKKYDFKVEKSDIVFYCQCENSNENNI